MGTGSNATANNGVRAPSRGKGSVEPGVRRRPRSTAIADTITTSRDFANFMSALMGDIVSGRIDPKVANAACNAGGKLLKVVELEYEFSRRANGGKQDDRALPLAGAVS